MITIFQVERLRSPYYKAFRVEWNKLLYNQIAPFIEAIRDGASMAQLSSIPINDKKTQDLFLKTWVYTGRFFAQANYSEHHKSISTQYRTKGTPEQEYYDRYLKDYCLNKAGDRIVSIDVTNNKAILRNIRTSLLEADTEGWGAAETAKFVQENLKAQMQIVSRWSAERIARTEIVGASNRGQLLGAQTLGYNMTKTWMPYIDSRTRTFEKGPFNHAITQTVNIYDKFTQTGGRPLDHPGDPDPLGEAGDVINCFLPDQLTYTKLTDIKKVYKSLYIGKVITIKTKNGNNFTCTPNHPILTTIGWIPANRINNINKLIHSDNIEARFSNFNINNKPSTFEQIYNSLSVIGHNVRIPAISVNFYGDIPDSDVNIISIKWNLLNRFKTTVNQIIKNVNFKLSNFRKAFTFSNGLFNAAIMMKFFRKSSHFFISLFSHLLFLIIGVIFKTNNICIRTISYFNSIFFKISNNCYSRYIIFIGKGKYTLLIPIFVKNFVKWENETIVFKNLTIIVNKDRFNGIKTSVEEFSSLFNTPGIVIKTDDVIDVCIHDYKGYVYTLETESQIYNINSNITRNCRCTCGYKVL